MADLTKITTSTAHPRSLLNSRRVVAQDFNLLVDEVEARLSDLEDGIVDFTTITVDAINEHTSAHGVVIDSVTLKDGGVTAVGNINTTVSVGTQALTITSSSQTENDLCYITTDTSVASAALMKTFNVSMRTTGASTSNMIEVSRFTLESAVKNGVWANAIVGKIDFKTTGYVTGLAGVICAELDLPSTNPSGGAGTYTCFEAELNVPSAFTSTVPVSFMNMNVWGANVATFDTNGFIFDITGVSVASGKVFQVNTAGDATHALRIRINNVPYYIMLTNTGA